uniref:Uncharacterized protein n=1 Tax=Ciona savignyi TaxID=51511 RepID=H2YGS1_CIOSA
RAVGFHPRTDVFAVGSNSQILKICSLPRTQYTGNHAELMGTGLSHVY